MQIETMRSAKISKKEIRKYFETEEGMRTWHRLQNRIAQRVADHISMIAEIGYYQALTWPRKGYSTKTHEWKDGGLKRK
jgi:hypothetical protein